MKYARLGRAIAISIFVLGLFWFSSVALADYETLFEVHGPFSSSVVWGYGTFTVADRVASEYVPAEDQTVCQVEHLITRNTSATAYDLVLSVYEGGTQPENGSLLAQKSVSSLVVPTSAGIPLYTEFKLDSCLNLKSANKYWFVWTRSQLQAWNGYNSYYRGDEYSNAKGWFYLTYGPYGWIEYPGRELAFRLKGPIAKEPVIIVPGILGSRLNRVSDGEEVWPNMAKMLDPLHPQDEYLDYLKLENNGREIIDINSAGVIKSVLGLNQYGNLIKIFEDNGYELGQDLFVMPYDWRLDIRISSQEFDSVIGLAIENSPTGKVNIIAHSMGGLLTKDYLMRNGESNVNKVIFAGTPHLGAPKAFNLLNWGDDFDLKFLWLGLNKSKAKEIGQNMPAVYQLLPSREYLSRVGNYVNDLNYEQTKELMTSGPLLEDYRNSALLDIGDMFHQSHDDWFPQSAEIYNLLGCREYDTIGSFQIEDDGFVDIGSITGDGTVPLVSAEHIPGNNYYVPYPQTKINHMGLVSDDRTIGLIHEIITDSVSALPSGISQNESDCDNILEEVKRLRLSTHSPVNLHVYDELGNHTGLTGDGNIELGIPDSNFVQVGGNSFIFVSDRAELDGAVYTVKIDAYATGSFDFKIKELINGEVESSVIYEDVLIDNFDLKADLEFTDISSVNTLEVDRNGDGISDAGYSTDGSWIPYNATIQTTLDDLDRIYILGWTDGEVKNSLKMLLEASLPTVETVQSKGKRANGVLGAAFLNQLEAEYNKGNINEKGYGIIKADILWLLMQ